MRNHFRNLQNYALSSILRYRIRTVVVLLCMTLSITLFSSVLFIKDGLTYEYQTSLKYSPDVTVQGIVNGRPNNVDMQYLSFIENIYRVDFVVPRVWGYGNIGNTLLVIVGVDLNRTKNLPLDYPIESGTFLEPTRNGTVVLGKAVAEILGAKVGDRLNIISESNHANLFEVIGILNARSTIYSADAIIMQIDDARAFFSMPQDEATDLMVYTNKQFPEQYTQFVNAIAREISRYPNVRVLTKDLLQDAAQNTLGTRSGFISIVWYLVLVAVAVVAFNQMVVVGHESKFEVGLLKALGFSTNDIIQIRLMEASILGVIAGSLGLLFGIFYTSILQAPVLKEYMLGWATLYPNQSIPILITPETLFLVYIISIVPLLLTSAIPSWLNATVDPDIAMRSARA